MKIIYVNSPARTGKDEFCKLCKPYIKCKVVSTVDYIKDIAKREFAWDGVKDSRGRKLLASLRYAAGAYNMGPIVKIGKIIKKVKDPDVLFIMVREYTEMNTMQQMYGGKTLKVLRNVAVCETEQKFLDELPHNYTFDYVIPNNGTLDDLAKIAKKFCEEVF